MTSMHEKQVQLEQMGLKNWATMFITVFGSVLSLSSNKERELRHVLLPRHAWTYPGFRVAKNRIDVVYVMYYSISFTFMQIWCTVLENPFNISSTLRAKRAEIIFVIWPNKKG